MKKNIIFTIAALTLICSCAKAPQDGQNDIEKRYLDAWIEKNHPGIAGKSIFPGFYILNDIPGSGDLIGDELITPNFRANYRITDLKGNITSSSYVEDAYKLRTYTKTNFYGPDIFTRADNALYAGIEYAIRDMRIGGVREFLVPGWLMTNNRYDSENEYQENVTGTNNIFTLNIVERIQDIELWEQDSLSRFKSRNYPSAAMDTTGFYRKTLKKPSGEPFSNDTTFYINYIGRRLDGMVFDTNIADTAKVYGLYSASASYAPALINWTKEYSSITMTSSKSSVIKGFSYLLGKMGPYEKAVGMFISQYGYSSSGSGKAIPAYSPLLFEVEIVDND